MERKALNLAKLITASLITVSVLFAFTGCSAMFIEVCEDNITEYTADFLECIASESDNEALLAIISEHSDSKLEFPELTDEQSELVREDLELLKENYSIDKIKVKEDRKSATISITFYDVFVPEDGALYTGEKDAIQKQINKSRKKDVLLVLDVVRIDGDWIYDDLSEFVEMFFYPYQNVYFVGSDGLPEELSAEYIQQYAKDIIVDCLWYDPIMGVPLEENMMEATPYLQCVFYFNKPQKFEVEAVLMHEGSEVMRLKLPINNQVIATCDFGYDLQNKSFDSGEYTVELYVRDYLVSTSPVINVK